LKENDKLTKTMSIMKENYEKMCNENESLQKEPAKLKAILKPIIIKFKQLQEEFKKSEETNQNLIEENKKQVDYIEKLRDSFDKISKENEKVEALYDEHIKSNTELHEQNNLFKTHLGNAKVVIEKLANEVKTLRPQIQKLVPENEKLREIVENAKQGISQLFQENKELKREAEAIKNQYEAKMQGRAKENYMLKTEIQKLRTENDRVNVRLRKVIIGGDEEANNRYKW